jgi:hypothetical protein
MQVQSMAHQLQQQALVIATQQAQQAQAQNLPQYGNQSQQQYYGNLQGPGQLQQVSR